MRHFRLEWERDPVRLRPRLRDYAGVPDAAFDRFIAWIMRQGYPLNTLKKYAVSVALFLDYLMEADIYGRPALAHEIVEAVERYPGLRLAADTYRNAAQNGSDDKWCRIVASLGMRQIKRSSVNVDLAAINKFLALSESRARTDAAGDLLGSDAQNLGPAELFPLVATMRSSAEIEQIMRNSVLASVAKMSPPTVRNAGPLRQQQKASVLKSSIEEKAFPERYLSDLFAQANCLRDRLYWMILAGTGVRRHEGDQIPIDRVDAAGRTLELGNPDDQRASLEVHLAEKLSFKGRETLELFIIPSLRQRLFETLEEYLYYDYVGESGHGFLLQDTRTGRGEPFFAMSDRGKINAFKAASKRAGVPHRPSGACYTPHSLRHFYGTYMRNYVPTVDGHGLPLHEVKTLMGHAVMKSTEVYALEDRLILRSKLLSADPLIEFEDPSQVFLKTMADSHEAAANRIREVLNGSKSDK